MLSGIADGGVRWRRRQRRTENGQQQQVRTPGAHPAHVSAVEAQRAATSQVRGDCGTGQARAECKVQTKARGTSVLRRGARWLPRDADHAWPEAPPCSVANVDATPNATATAHPRASRGRAIASKFRRLRALQNQIQPMALKAQHTISKLRKKLIRGRDLLPELWGHDCGGDWSGH